ncbi:homoserine dehydrogenase [Natranaerobius thermophilus]|uniref:Homoserine dehydrogenase n=1 Tax=Natranaerobius thermophilus (strain ATCC BAA-1301 / DSM 18059 / JW/NM-WN-LF) TaxID=457570 RepID=B2A768_NATTJ|nr:homoserine dehydrogenase [Natranaerobius thermophilus]ACB84262.1 Homoserine dehydrogenase [Natranaerobius thermophilus JW/NM-WN-LF]
MTSTIKIGFLGFGTVGTGTVEVLTENKDLLTERVNAVLEVEKILVKNKTKSRTTQLNQNFISDKLTDDPEEILRNQDIQIVVEVMGTEEPALSYMKKAIKAGKHVVTANKEVIAKHGEDLTSLAKNNGVNFLYEASVAGGVPVIRPLKACLAGNTVKEISGILNGTTNYILTEMEEKEAEFNEALKKAQELGYAESDPTDDVEGFDAVRKLAIMTSMATNSTVLPEDIYTEGISGVTKEDLQFLGDHGYKIKLLGQTKINGTEVESRVAPTFLPCDNPLSSVSGVYNSILIKGEPVGYLTFTGEGAGKEATSSAVLSDIIEAARNGKHSNNFNGWSKNNFYKILDKEETSSLFYLRLVSSNPSQTEQEQKVNKSEIQNLLNHHGIELQQLDKKSSSNGKQELFIITELAKEQNVQNAISDLQDKSVELINIIRGDNSNGGR